jgi:SAM-dependent methyltransferase
MPTHQDLTGTSDDEMLRRMIASHRTRFNDEFWRVFHESVLPFVPLDGTVIDIGCGPGLFLQEISRQFPRMALHGCDVTDTMIDNAHTLAYGGGFPVLHRLDLRRDAIPVADGSANLVTMTAVMHLFDDPLRILSEVRRVLYPMGGIFLIYDWVRTSIRSYMGSRNIAGYETQETSDRKMLRLFPVHNRYTTGDWRWLLNRGGFQVRYMARPRKHFIMFVATPNPKWEPNT